MKKKKIEKYSNSDIFIGHNFYLCDTISTKYRFGHNSFWKMNKHGTFFVVMCLLHHVDRYFYFVEKVKKKKKIDNN